MNEHRPETTAESDADSFRAIAAAEGWMQDEKAPLIAGEVYRIASQPSR
jgi:hypothetical protein